MVTELMIDDVISHRKMHASGTEEGNLMWIESGNKGDKWQMAQLSVEHKEAFWVIINFWQIL